MSWLTIDYHYQVDVVFLDSADRILIRIDNRLGIYDIPSGNYAELYDLGQDKSHPYSITVF